MHTVGTGRHESSGYPKLASTSSFSKEGWGATAS